MDFREWEPVYEAILADFGYERAGDERARDRLDELLESSNVEGFDRLNLDGKTVAIAGAAPGLESELDRVRSADAVVAASDAATRLRTVGCAVDCMVTDLDKRPDTARELAADGKPVAIHAHGDNVPALDRHVPTIEHEQLIPTTQARPICQVRNFGGFTDGDRAAFLADALGADRLVFPGWDFEDPSVGAEKRRKLLWAARLLYWLERRRDEEFDVLDQRRESTDTSFLDRR